ncbi:hypothetical protein MTR_2g104170 [Medicago truncatula]|uniref:Uncharacterized protein n=1 Tax=Medicago truncatula TaxID=3880 RepID=G7II99_MEDTR|nr:hypothetical protein MTR_2g104170 [Medicago truncatula]
MGHVIIFFYYTGKEKGISQDVYVSALVGRELRGALLIYVGSLVGRSFFIRDWELVFLTQVLSGFLVAPPTYRKLSVGRI